MMRSPNVHHYLELDRAATVDGSDGCRRGGGASRCW